MRCGSEELRRCLNSVTEGVHLLHVEHHEGPTRHRDQRVQDADHEERRRRSHLSDSAVAVTDLIFQGFDIVALVDSVKP